MWILAAKWEFENNKNADNARTLMQRGLRFNPASKALWLEVSVGHAWKILNLLNGQCLSMDNNWDEDSEFVDVHHNTMQRAFRERNKIIQLARSLTCYPMVVHVC